VLGQGSHQLPQVMGARSGIPPAATGDGCQVRDHTSCHNSPVVSLFRGQPGRWVLGQGSHQLPRPTGGQPVSWAAWV